MARRSAYTPQRDHLIRRGISPERRHNKSPRGDTGGPMASRDRADETETEESPQRRGGGEAMARQRRVGVDRSCTLGNERTIAGWREPDAGWIYTTWFSDPVFSICNKNVSTGRSWSDQNHGSVVRGNESDMNRD